MNKRWIVILSVLALSLSWAASRAQQGSSEDWEGFVQGTEVQMPTTKAPSPFPGLGQEVPIMYGPGGAEALLNAVRRSQTPEGQNLLKSFLPQQNTIDGFPPAAPPLGASFTGPAWGGIWIPGDPVIAAGSTYVGVMINSQCDFYTKAGVWSGGSILKIFFSPVYDSINCRDPFDVKIIYDHHANKWVMLALTYCSASSQSFYLVAVSQTMNPLGSWWIWALDVMDPLEPIPLWADYPGLGFDADSGVYVTSNQYLFGGPFQYAKIRAIRKGALYSGTAVWWDYWNMSDFDGTITFTIKPAHTFGNPGTEYLVNTKWFGGNSADVWSLLPGDPFVTNLGAVAIGWYWPPPIPPCSDSGLNLFDCRTQDAQYRNEHVYTSFHEEWDWGSGIKAVVRFLKINIPTMTPAIDERYGNPDYHYFFPSIYSARNDNIITVFNRCGYGELPEFISARYSARFLTQGDVASRASLYLKAGQAWYGDWVNPNRWGDYSGIAYDPYQFCTMWIYSMYATNAPKPANWSTWIGSVFTHPQIEKNHFKTWRIEPQTFSTTVFVEDQFMSDELVLDQIEFFSNPVKKDTFEIVDSLEHLTWYRANGRDTLLEVEYQNQFESTTVLIDSVKYLLLPTAKWSSDIPESLDHYKAYRIKDPLAFEAMPVLNDQFDLEYGEPEFIDSLKPIYFLTPALKNMPQPMFDSITHYVAYEIFPQRFFSIPVNTFDQFGTHVLQVDTSKILLVPTRKLRAEPPPPPNHYKTWRILPQTFDTTVFVQDQFMEDSLSLFSLEYISNPVKKVVDNDTFDIVSPNDHLTWYRAFGRDTLIQVGWVNQFQTVPMPIPIDSVKYLLVPTQKLPHAQPESLDHYKCYRIAMDTGWMEINFTLQDQFDPIPEEITAMSTPIYFCAPCKKNDEPTFDTTTHYVAYLISPQHTISESRATIDQFGLHSIQVQNSEMLLVPSKKWIPAPCDPPNIGCPADETQNQNGVYTTTTQWTADDGNPGDLSVELISVAVQPPLPPGISVAVVNFAGPVPGPGLGVKSTWGTVTYIVTDHCQAGGNITLITTNNCPPPNNTATCTFNVSLTNNPPVITQPDFLEGYVDDSVQYTITGTDPDGDVILDSASIDIQPGCGTYYITRLSGHGASSGTWEIRWFTDGCTPCDTHMVIHDLTDGCDTSYCTTWVHLAAPESLYWKPPYEDYAPNGMPDIDQKQDNWVKDGIWTFCGPVAVANCFKWFDSKYNVPPGFPGDGVDQFPLVRDYMDNLAPFIPPARDDHDPWNVDHAGTPWGPPPNPPPPTAQPFVPGAQPQPSGMAAWGELVERLAWYFNTDGIQTGYCQFSGTKVYDMQAGIDAWFLSEQFPDGSTLADSLYERTLQMPTFTEVETLVEMCEDVILLLGFWYQDPSSGDWWRCGGHYVTVAGINSDSLLIAISDPFFNNAEMGGRGRVGDGTLIAHPHGSHGFTIHNDEGNVSHDIYDVSIDPVSPGGLWELLGYPVSLNPPECGHFEGQNVPDEFVSVSQPWNGTSPIFTEVEYAVVISPKPPNDPPEIIQPDTLYGYQVCDTVIYTFEGADPDSDAIQDTASLSIEPSCGTYSVTRLTGSGGPSGKWQVTWDTKGCQDSITYKIIVDLTDTLGNISYCTTYCHLDPNNPPTIGQPDFLEGFVDDEVKYQISGVDPDGDVIEDDASIDIQPGCGSGYSIARISGHGAPYGTWEIVWQTDGCTPCDTHMVIHDLTDGCDTSYCTTWVHLVAPESLYWKPPYEDYAPSGMPDIDQRQDGWMKFDTDQWSFCGPVAVANCFKWFDSKYNVPPGAPGDGFDQFPLVRDYLDNNAPHTGFDDHDPWNVDHTATAWNSAIGPPPPTPQPFVPGPQTPGQVSSWGELVERLAWYFNTDGIQTGYCGHTGTKVTEMQDGIDAWLRSEDLQNTLCEVTTKAPSFAYVESLVEKCEDVILLLGFWYDADPQQFIRGDVDANGYIELADIVMLMAGPPFLCDDAADANDDGVVDDLDSAYLWDYFYGGPAPPPPFPDCGPDPTFDNLGCAGFPPCPPPGGDWRRIGGHYVTVAGVNSEAYRIAFSDPFIDNAEFGAPGRVGNGILIPHSFPHDRTVHNDEGNVSHDIYSADTTSISPGGEWWLPGYAINGDPGYWSWNFYNQNVPDEFIDVTAPWDGTSSIHTEVEYCVHISPWDDRGDVEPIGGDGDVDLGDLLFIIAYCFKNGPAPVPYSEGDVNCDGNIDLGDILATVAYLYKNGPRLRCCDP